MKQQEVILVDDNNEVQGFMEKMEAHKKGALHRAFSIFVFNNKGELLLQQRARNKYHSGGLWTNTCCSHPVRGEETIDSAKRRLKEEMGFTTDLWEVFNFVYKAEMENGLTEHEYDHVFFGQYQDEPDFNKEEVMAFAYVSLDEIIKDVNRNPGKYSAWFRIALPRVIELRNA